MAGLVAPGSRRPAAACCSPSCWRDPSRAGPSLCRPGWRSWTRWPFSAWTARLKWPNDVLIEGRKCAGVLIEGRIAGGRAWLLLGIGVNVRSADPSLPGCHLRRRTRAGSRLRARSFWRVCSRRLEWWLDQAEADPGRVRDAWTASLATLGERGRRDHGLGHDPRPCRRHCRRRSADPSPGRWIAHRDSRRRRHARLGRSRGARSVPLDLLQHGKWAPQSNFHPFRWLFHPIAV